MRSHQVRQGEDHQNTGVEINTGFDSESEHLRLQFLVSHEDTIDAALRKTVPEGIDTSHCTIRAKTCVQAKRPRMGSTVGRRIMHVTFAQRKGLVRNILCGHLRKPRWGKSQ